MTIERAREDVAVAASACLASVVVAVSSSLVSAITVETLPALAPIVVYIAYRFSRKGGPYGSIDTPRNWTALALVAGAVVLAAGAL